MQVLAVGEALQAHAAAVAEARAGDRADELAHGVGDEHLATVRAVHHARGEVDRRAEQLALALLHLAGADPDPYPQPVLACRELALDRQRARDAAARRVKQHQEAVTRRAGLPAAVRGDRVAHDPVVLREQARSVVVAEPRRRLRGPLEVREHDGGDAARAWGTHGRSPADSLTAVRTLQCQRAMLAPA